MQSEYMQFVCMQFVYMQSVCMQFVYMQSVCVQSVCVQSVYMWVSGFKYKIFLEGGFLRYGRVSSRQPILFSAIVFMQSKR